MSSSLSLLARIPPCTAGWSVFTLPSNTSGCPVASLTSMTEIPAARSFRAVPPVDRICQFMSERALESSSTPSLCQTLINARGCAMGRHAGTRLEGFYLQSPLEDTT